MMCSYLVEYHHPALPQDGLCSKETAPSVSSISRVLRSAGHISEEGEGSGGERPSHSIDGILGKRAKHVYQNNTIKPARSTGARAKLGLLTN